MRSIVTLAVLFAMTAPLAREAGATEWPLDRIVANLEQSIRASPDDAQAHYCLGRAHAFAFALKRSTLWVYDEVRVADLDLQGGKSWWRKDAALPRPVPTESELLVHLAEGVKHLRRSCELAAGEERSHLTLAWLLESGSATGERVDNGSVFELSVGGMPPDRLDVLQGWVHDLSSKDAALVASARSSLADPANLEPAVPLLQIACVAEHASAAVELLRQYWVERAIREYWSAFELAFPGDVEDKFADLRNENERHHMVSYEALTGYRRLVEQRGARSAEEEKRLEELADKQKKLDEKPLSNWITPLVVTLDRCASLEEVTAPQLTVPFDLDGNGLDELWPWIAPTSGWLVWDPNHRDEITSGRQLFGSTSGWLFFEDGYHVLDAFDDNGDGELRGDELAGIAVWFDRDSDGISDRGEVVPVEELGIAALATHWTLRIGDSPANLCGLEMQDGRVLPTYDWVLTSVPEAHAAPRE